MSERRFEDTEFKTSSMCSPDSQTGCVAIAMDDQVVAVRDTKSQGTPDLYFTHEEWRAFTAGIKRGEFDL